MPNLLRFATAALMCLAAAPTFAQGVTYQIFNNGHRSLVQVFTAPASSGSWSEDHLAGTLLTPGRTVRMEVAADDQGCAIKLLFVFEDGGEMTDTADACTGRPYMMLRHG